ncbi:MAG: hypothetical protein ACYC7B_01295 [Burkholderiales bacterium]
MTKINILPQISCYKKPQMSRLIAHAVHGCRRWNRRGKPIGPMLAPTRPNPVPPFKTSLGSAKYPTH